MKTNIVSKSNLSGKTIREKYDAIITLKSIKSFWRIEHSGIVLELIKLHVQRNYNINFSI